MTPKKQLSSSDPRHDILSEIYSYIHFALAIEAPQCPLDLTLAAEARPAVSTEIWRSSLRSNGPLRSGRG